MPPVVAVGGSGSTTHGAAFAPINSDLAVSRGAVVNIAAIDRDGIAEPTQNSTRSCANLAYAERGGVVIVCGNIMSATYRLVTDSMDPSHGAEARVLIRNGSTSGGILIDIRLVCAISHG
ncbi:hypothetical protein VX037_18710 [Gordonia sp. Z-3]|uniref:hypothetical protein n=1 Tax=Gordonia sp. Z-3 TaxID=3115408 RepID=UPI002E2C6BA8|nr:hypothetical protein [Gordonia sp. Z-3]MED5803060.1 hypothetical protein [Gordonia sp. Z-3]